MALACGVRMRLTATLNSLIIAGVISCTSTPRAVESAFCRLPRWSMAAAAMTPRSLASAVMRFILPADRFTGLLWHARGAPASVHVSEGAPGPAGGSEERRVGKE